MEEAIVTFAQQHGPWATFCLLMFVACCLLVRWVLRTSEAREAGLHAMIGEQSVAMSRQMETIESQSSALHQIAVSLERIERKLQA